MKRILTIAILTLVLHAGAGRAEMYVAGTETAGVTTVARQLSSIPSNAHKTMVTVRGGAISWFADGQTPTGANGNVTSDGGTIYLECQDEMAKFRAVLSSGESGVSIYSGESGATIYGHYLGNR